MEIRDITPKNDIMNLSKIMDKDKDFVLNQYISICLDEESNFLKENKPKIGPKIQITEIKLNLNSSFDSMDADVVLFLDDIENESSYSNY